MVEPKRAVLIQYADEHGRPGRASGLHLHHDVVLTAAHCAHGTGYRVWTDGEALPADVVWLAPGDEPDIAVLRVDGLSDVPRIGVATVDRTAGAELDDCLVRGFPAWFRQRDDTGPVPGGYQRWEGHATLLLGQGAAPAVGTPSEPSLAFTPDKTWLPPERTEVRTTWRGVSGAGVCTTGPAGQTWCVGVVTEGDRRAAAAPLSVATFDMVEHLDPRDADALWALVGHPAPLRRGPVPRRVVQARHRRPLDLPRTYVDRHFESLVRQAWDSGTSRVALVGDGGVGKSFVARHIWADALRAHRAGPGLLVFVEPATVGEVVSAYSDAAGRLGIDDPSPDAGESGRPRRMADELLALLRDAPWPWMVILDNADPSDVPDDRLPPDIIGDLYTQGLLPPESPWGRTLITSRQHSQTFQRLGDEIDATVFDDDEALDYLRRHPALSREADTTLLDVAAEVGGLPLALSISAATIVESGEPAAVWLEQFRQADSLDDVTAGHDDPDFYPVRLSRAWRTALASAAAGEPAPGVTARAALVCAVLSTTGHPAWLWQTDAVRQLVWQGNPPTMLGRPDPLRRLAGYSLVTFSSGPALLRWEDTLVSIHRMTAKAVQSSHPDTVVEQAVRACADALLDTEWQSPTAIRLTADSMLALLHSRGRRGLAVKVDSSWTAHDLLRSVLTAAAAQCIADLPILAIDDALATTFPRGSVPLAGLRLTMSKVATISQDVDTLERLARSAMEVDTDIVDGRWCETVDEIVRGSRGAVCNALLARGDIAAAETTLDKWESSAKTLEERLHIAAIRLNAGIDGSLRRFKSVLAEAQDGPDEAVKEIARMVVRLLPWIVRQGVLGDIEPGPSDEHRDREELFYLRITNIMDLPVGEAATLMDEAVKRLGRYNPLTVLAMGDYCEILAESGQEEEACRLAIETHHRYVEHRHTRQSIDFVVRANLAYWVARSGALDEAIALQESLLTEIVAEFGPTHRLALAELNELANNLRTSQRLDEAARRFDELARAYAASSDIGPTHADTLAARRQHAFCTGRSGHRAEAVQLYEGLLPDLIAHQGPTHPVTRAALDDLERILTADRSDDAETHHQESETTGHASATLRRSLAAEAGLAALRAQTSSAISAFGLLDELLDRPPSPHDDEAQGSVA